MEVLTGSTDFARFVASCLGPESAFRLVDVGCSNGIHGAFRTFGERLTAWAFDINGDECARLRATETLPDVRYIAGKVGLPEGHPFLAARAGRPWLPGNPWERLSVAATLRMHHEKASVEPASVPPSVSVPPAQIDLVAFLAEEGIADLDFLKIDVDGDDFAILCGLEGRLGRMRTLGVGIEVNFFGTDEPTDHTLHNVDRFMRREGFELFGLTIRHYSAAALPARYRYDSAAETLSGRPLQGDALYVRDLCAPTQRGFADGLPPAKLAKAAAIFSLANLPDCAAEVLTTFRGIVDALMRVDAALDLLTVAARQDGMPASYRDYVDAFGRDARCFYNWRPGVLPPDLGEAIASRDESAATSTRAGTCMADPGPEIVASTAEAARLRAEVRALRTSRSWRLTAPVRTLGATARRILHGRARSGPFD